MTLKVFSYKEHESNEEDSRQFNTFVLFAPFIAIFQCQLKQLLCGTGHRNIMQKDTALLRLPLCFRIILLRAISSIVITALIYLRH